MECVLAACRERSPRIRASLRQAGRQARIRLSRVSYHVLKAWIALILWLIVIAIESTTYLSAQGTSRFLYPLLHFLFGIDYAGFEPYHFLLRKTGHVFGYGLLSILLF